MNDVWLGALVNLITSWRKYCQLGTPGTHSHLLLPHIRGGVLRSAEDLVCPLVTKWGDTAQTWPHQTTFYGSSIDCRLTRAPPSDSNTNGKVTLSAPRLMIWAVLECNGEDKLYGQQSGDRTETIHITQYHVMLDRVIIIRLEVRGLGFSRRTVCLLWAMPGVET